MWRAIVGGVTLLASLTGAGAAAAVAADVPATAPDEALAIAAPSFEPPPLSSGISLARGAVLWEATGARGLEAIRRADHDGTVVSIHSAPPRASIFSSGFAASASHAALLRDGFRRRTGCRGRLRCFEPLKSGLFAGRARGPLRHLVDSERRFFRRSGCRRGRALLTDRAGLEPSLSISGRRVVYQERLQCPEWRRSHYELVLHDIRSDRRRIVHRGAVRSAQLAGDFLAYEPPPTRHRARGLSWRMVVVDLRTGQVVYRTPPTTFSRHLAWPSLDADGTLAGGHAIGELSLDLRIGWFSPAQPVFHALPVRAAISRDAPLLLADGRIAFLRGLGEAETELAIVDLEGNVETYATFGESEEIADLAFDGERIAWVLLRYRPYRGPQDDGLSYVCGYPGPKVLERAPVIEMRPANRPGRFPIERLPFAPPARNGLDGAPSCSD
jgi:hypothetical protein